MSARTDTTQEGGLPVVLLAIALPAASLARLEEVATVIAATTHEARMSAVVQSGARIRALVTNGVTIIPAELIEALPALTLISAIAVGHEGIDMAAARARGIAITNGPGTNAESVADHTLAIMLAALRDIPACDTMVREGGWRTGQSMRPMASGKRVGILGLGDIGARVAQRCASFNMTVSYHNRRRKAESPWRYLASPLDLARESDILIVTLPGVPATKHLIGKAELAALGPGGFLVNVGRGSVLDTAALIEALRDNRLAGAALDVVEGEPTVPPALRELRNVVFTPHVAGRSPESVKAAIKLLVSNLVAHFRGEPLPTPVPG